MSLLAAVLEVVERFFKFIDKTVACVFELWKLWQWHGKMDLVYEVVFA